MNAHYREKHPRSFVSQQLFEDTRSFTHAMEWGACRQAIVIPALLFIPIRLQKRQYAVFGMIPDPNLDAPEARI